MRSLAVWFRRRELEDGLRGPPGGLALPAGWVASLSCRLWSLINHPRLMYRAGAEAADIPGRMTGVDRAAAVSRFLSLYGG